MNTNYVKPEIGQVYTLRNGGEYRCLSVSDVDRVEQGECNAVMIRDADGWELTVHGLQQNENGTVEWNYSTGGHWTKNKPSLESQIYRAEQKVDPVQTEAPVKENER